MTHTCLNKAPEHASTVRVDAKELSSPTHSSGRVRGGLEGVIDECNQILRRSLYNAGHHDIVSIDVNVKRKLENECKDIKKLERLLEVLNGAKLDEGLSVVKSAVCDRIMDIEQKNTFSDYILSSFEVLETYRQHIKKPLKVKFFKSKEDPKKDTLQQIESDSIVQSCIENYFNILSKYFNIPALQMVKPKVMICKSCEGSNFDFLDDYKKVCLQCGTECTILSTNSTYKDSTRVNVTTKYTYAEIIHFRDCINQYQAKQNKRIPDSIYSDLELQFKLNRLLVDSSDISVKYGKITKTHILMFLKESGHSSFYKDTNFIYYKITHKTPPDISHIESQLYDDFKSLLEVYYEMPNKDRSIFLNYQFIFYQLLKKYKIKLDDNDFILLKTIDCIDDHNDLCQRMFEKKGWTFSSYT